MFAGKFVHGFLHSDTLLKVNYHHKGRRKSPLYRIKRPRVLIFISQNWFSKARNNYSCCVLSMSLYPIGHSQIHLSEHLHDCLILCKQVIVELRGPMVHPVNVITLFEAIWDLLLGHNLSPALQNWWSPSRIPISQQQIYWIFAKKRIHNTWSRASNMKGLCIIKVKGLTLEYECWILFTLEMLIHLIQNQNRLNVKDGPGFAFTWSVHEICL